VSIFMSRAMMVCGCACSPSSVGALTSTMLGASSASLRYTPSRTRRCRCGSDGVPTFVEVGTPSDGELHALLHTVITRPMTLVAHRGALVENMGQTHLAESADA
jgi:hypothetical protein